ncbi:MAG: hypothetical protein DWQ01_17035 [Planctomycetota bacterium]|nr:MAG: hypothetical protein DWQ01_17035 [Planctomycetota bacterium]
MSKWRFLSPRLARKYAAFGPLPPPGTVKRLHLRPPLFTLLLVLFSSGCSVLGEDYAESQQAALAAFERGNFRMAAKRFQQEKGALDSHEWLALVETGMAWHAAGRLEKATEFWLKAVEVSQAFGDRPTVSGRSLAEGAASAVLNDKTLPYDGEGFEVVLLHSFLAWDYLRMGRLDDAWVEVNLAYDLQDSEQERFQSTYGMNRFARFVAALVQELDGEADEAQMDLRKLSRELPNHPAVQYSLERVRKLQGPESSSERRLAQLVVLLERGRMPAKQPKEMAYQGFRSFGRVSVPSYIRYGRGGSGQVNVMIDGASVGTPESLEDVFQVARANLRDRMNWLAAKATARSIGKTVLVEVAAEAVAEEHGEAAGALVGILGSALNFLSERADLRSWLTLPSAIHVLRVPVEPGEHEIHLQFLGSGISSPPKSLGRRNFEAGKPVFVTVRTLGRNMYAHVDGGSIVPQP